MNVEELKNNLREIKREVTPKMIKGKKWYELTVIQEYAEENVKNMLNSFNQQIKANRSWLDSFDDLVEKSTKEAEAEVERLRQGLVDELALSDEEVLANWQKEKEEKLKFLNNIDEHRKDAVENVKQQLDAMKVNCQMELAKTEAAVQVWENVNPK